MPKPQSIPNYTPYLPGVEGGWGFTLTGALNNHNSSEFVIRSGVPQGSILGPVLFIIFMNDISLSQVSDPLLSWYIYADDTTKRSTTKTIDNLRQTMFKDSKPRVKRCLNKQRTVVPNLLVIS